MEPVSLLDQAWCSQNLYTPTQHASYDSVHWDELGSGEYALEPLDAVTSLRKGYADHMALNAAPGTSALVKDFEICGSPCHLQNTSHDVLDVDSDWCPWFSPDDIMLDCDEPPLDVHATNAEMLDVLGMFDDDKLQQLDFGVQSGTSTLSSAEALSPTTFSLESESYLAPSTPHTPVTSGGTLGISQLCKHVTSASVAIPCSSASLASSFQQQISTAMTSAVGEMAQYCTDINDVARSVPAGGFAPCTPNNTPPVARFGCASSSFGTDALHPSAAFPSCGPASAGFSSPAHYSSSASNGMSPLAFRQHVCAGEALPISSAAMHGTSCSVPMSSVSSGMLRMPTSIPFGIPLSSPHSPSAFGNCSTASSPSRIQYLPHSPASHLQPSFPCYVGSPGTPGSSSLSEHYSHSAEGTASIQSCLHGLCFGSQDWHQACSACMTSCDFAAQLSLTDVFSQASREPVALPLPSTGGPVGLTSQMYRSGIQHGHASSTVQDEQKLVQERGFAPHSPSSGAALHSAVGARSGSNHGQGVHEYRVAKQSCRGCGVMTANSFDVADRRIPLCSRWESGCQHRWQQMMEGKLPMQCQGPDAEDRYKDTEPLNLWVPGMVPGAKLRDHERRDLCRQTLVAIDDTWKKLFDEANLSQ